MEDFSSERKWAVSCYVPVIGFVVCLLASIRMINNKFVLFHARQGLVIFALTFLTLIVSIISERLGWMFQGIVLLSAISGMIIALKMRMIRLPIIGRLAMMIPEDYVFKKLTGNNNNNIN